MSLNTEVRQYIKYWQKYLRLMDWTFSYRLNNKIDAFAEAMIHTNFQMVRIQVRDPATIPEEWMGCRDLEVTVLHEMLHVRLAFMGADKKSTDCHEEMSVETISKALVAHKRGINLEDLV